MRSFAQSAVPARGRGVDRLSVSAERNRHGRDRAFCCCVVAGPRSRAKGPQKNWVVEVASSSPGDPASWH